MDITNFIVSRREKALLIGDYASYRKQLSKRLLVVRKKLNYTSSKGKKYAERPAVTAEDIASNHEFIHLLLLISERAWALAMHMKSTHSAESGAHGISGSTKSHIHSRLHKASTYAGQLVELLKVTEITKATPEALLEARAYHVSLRGAIEFEKQSWEDCLREYSEARFIYTTLAQTRGPKQEDLFQDLLNATIDPSIRYAAYQLKLPRTASIDTIISRYVPKSSEFVQKIFKEHPDALDDPATAQKKTPSGNAENVPKTIEWRSRVVNLEDAATAQALAAVSNAETRLSAFLTSNLDATPQDKAGAYDEVLIPSQDAVDATKTAIDELSAEGVPQGDRRMQALQITRTAVNYALVGWRIGRNRILCGRQDGALLEPEIHKKPRKDEKTTTKPQEESTGRKLTRLRERVVLYDSTLQSLDSVRELPGVAADQTFLEELEAKRAYFAALRCLAIARSHALLSETMNALSLLSRALEYSSRASPRTSTPQTTNGKPPNLDITSAQASNLHSLLQNLVAQHRALVELHNIQSASMNKNTGSVSPLIERLDEYPSTEVDLAKLVTYPPKIEPIPVKPLFLDVAYNYIDYPGRTQKGNVKATAVNGVAEGSRGGEEKKKGWFGFGR